MRRGSTPTLKFSHPYLASQIEGGWLTMVQRGVIVLDKDLTEEGAAIKDYVIVVDLTEEETLRFSEATNYCEAQIRLKLITGKRTSSKIVEVDVDAILKEGPI